MGWVDFDRFSWSVDSFLQRISAKMGGGINDLKLIDLKGVVDLEKLF